MRTAPVVLGALALVAAACQSPRPAQQSQTGQTKLDPSTPVAKVHGQVITAGQLEEKIKREERQLEQQYQEQLYQLRKSALEAMIQKQVVEDKAKAAGVAPEDLVKNEIAARTPAPTEQEIRALYERAKSAGRPVPPFDDKVKQQIAQFMQQQSGQSAYQEYVEGLKKEAGVEILLPPYLAPKVEVAAVGPSKGPESAPITIVEFSDFQCPFCSRAEPTVTEVLQAYPGKIRLVYRDFPLPSHGDAPKAAEAALCAADQGKFWEMHGRLFANQDKLKVGDLKVAAKELGLDGAKFDQCLDSGTKAKAVEDNRKAGEEAGVTGTPAFFINGRLLSGAQPLTAFKTVIDEELKARN
jgi:protein-disulfide isomerase